MLVTSWWWMTANTHPVTGVQHHDLLSRNKEINFSTGLALLIRHLHKPHTRTLTSNQHRENTTACSAFHTGTERNDWHSFTIGHVARLADDVPANQILWTCCEAQSGVRPSPDWRHARGRPPTTWIHQIRRDMGILVTDALELAENRLFWRQIATAGCYGWTLCVMMMMMMMMMMMFTICDTLCPASTMMNTSAGSSAGSGAASQPWWTATSASAAVPG